MLLFKERRRSSISRRAAALECRATMFTPLPKESRNSGTNLPNGSN